MENIELEMVRGDDDGFTFEIIEDTEGELPVDLTGCRIDLHIKPDRGGVIKLSTETGEITIEGNFIYVSVAHAETKGVKWENATWDLQIIDLAKKVRTPVGGEFTLTLDVTEIDDD